MGDELIKSEERKQAELRAQRERELKVQAAKLAAAEEANEDDTEDNNNDSTTVKPILAPIPEEPQTRETTPKRSEKMGKKSVPTFMGNPALGFANGNQSAGPVPATSLAAGPKEDVQSEESSVLCCV